MSEEERRRKLIEGLSKKSGMKNPGWKKLNAWYTYVLSIAVKSPFSKYNEFPTGAKELSMSEALKMLEEFSDAEVFYLDGSDQWTRGRRHGQ